MEKWNILSVDDDPKIGQLLREYMEEDGHAVHVLLDGASVPGFLDQNKVDVILLDVVLPDTDGLQLMREIRTRSKAPIIVVSGKGDTMDRVIGLELGADDYVAKPFHLREISARIKTVIRRGNDGGEAREDAKPESLSGANLLQFEGWTVDNAKHELRDPAGSVVPLTTGEFVMLQILVQSPQRVLSRDFLFEQTRDEDFEAYDRAVDIQITRLRKKLNDDPKEPRFIKTVRGVGYMFIAPVNKAA